MKLILIFIVLVSACGFPREERVCVEGELYYKEDGILYPVMGFSEQRKCLNAREAIKG